jgi:hypothetical protein
MRILKRRWMRRYGCEFRCFALLRHGRKGIIRRSKAFSANWKNADNSCMQEVLWQE